MMQDSLNQIPLPPGWKLEKTKEDLYLHTNEGRPFCLDFSKLKSLSSKQPLAKAIGKKASQKVRVLDLTAGWGKDACLLARLSYEVTAIESHPLVFAFLQSALRKSLKKNFSLNFALDNSINYLKSIKDEERPEVIYMDPMFGDKKSLSVKPLRILRQLVGEPASPQELFQAALGKALDRIVVKRHKHEKPMSLAPLKGTFSGRAICYDVYFPQNPGGVS
ncbi:MAG: class I SAM-dependent methyltransferase [Bdellovibrionales bacterium]